MTRKSGGGGAAKRGKPRAKKQKPPNEETAKPAYNGGGGVGKGGMASQLLDKFPPFDPAWPDEIKTKWFSGFERLMESADKAGQI